MLCGHPEPDKRSRTLGGCKNHVVGEERIGSEVAGFRIVSALGQGRMDP